MTTDTSLTCLDCGKPYADFPLDVVLSNGQWKMIHEAERGVLCANCIVARAQKLPGATVCHLWVEIGAGPIERRLHELERAIEDAPHDKFCRSRPDYDPEYRTFDAKCNCWKSRAAAGGE